MEQSIFVYHCNQHVNLFGNHYSKQDRKTMKISSFTCAVDLVEIDFLLSFTETLVNATRRGNFIPVTIGTALCHLDDCYNKKVGAKLATERMAPVLAQVIDLRLTNLGNNRWHMAVDFEFPTLGLTMKVRQDDKRQRPTVSFD